MADHLDAETYAYLRNLAQRIHNDRAGKGGTMQPTALLHEAWMKLDQSTSTYRDRGHFLAVAAKAMRQILVDHARARKASKRGGPHRMHTTLAGVTDGAPSQVDVVVLDGLLNDLQKEDPFMAEVVVLRVFGGLEVAEIAESTGTSVSTVYRSWRFARAWLGKHLNGVA